MRRDELLFKTRWFHSDEAFFAVNKNLGLVEFVLRLCGFGNCKRTRKFGYLLYSRDTSSS